MIVEGTFEGLAVDEAFTRNTDGPECPVSRSYAPAEFTEMCSEAGFESEYLGGYPSIHEVARLEESWARAIVDERLGSEHREFLRELQFDFRGFPLYRGRHAGIGGTYRLRKA